MAAPLLQWNGKYYQRSAVKSWDKEPSLVDSVWRFTITFLDGTTLQCDYEEQSQAQSALSVMKNETEVDILDAL